MQAYLFLDFLLSSASKLFLNSSNRLLLVNIAMSVCVFDIGQSEWEYGNLWQHKIVPNGLLSKSKRFSNFTGFHTVARANGYKISTPRKRVGRSYRWASPVMPVTDIDDVLEWWYCLSARLHSCWDAVLDENTSIIRQRSLDVYRVFLLDSNLQAIDLQTPMYQWCKLLAELAMCRASIEYGNADDAHDLVSLTTCHEPIMRICELHRWECERNSPIDRRMHHTWNDANRLYQISHVVRSCNVVRKRAAQLINAFDPDRNHLNMIISGSVRVDPEVCAFFGLDDTRPMNVAVRWRRNEDGVALNLQHDRVCCVHCGRVAAGKVRLKLCSVCRTVAYCDRACQVQDWERHREYCVGVRVHVKKEPYAGETVRAPDL